MARNRRHTKAGWREEAKGYGRLALLLLGLGALAGAAFVGWRLAGHYVVDTWQAIPPEIRLALQLSTMAVAVSTAVLATVKAVREYKGRKVAKQRARDTPPLFEFSAGSITQAMLKEGDKLDPEDRQGLKANRRQYLVRPKDALPRPKHEWAGPVQFHEPTRAGDTRINPVLALAARERKKHQENMVQLLKGTGQLSSARIVLGVGKGYTSLTRAHALRDQFNRLQAKFRMNCIVTDPPAQLDRSPDQPTDTGEAEDMETEDTSTEEDTGEADTPFGPSEVSP